MRLLDSVIALKKPSNYVCLFVIGTCPKKNLGMYCPDFGSSGKLVWRIW